MNHRVHETVDGHRRPKRVVAQAVAAAWFRIKRNELTDPDGSHGAVQIVSFHFDANGSPEITGKIWFSSFDGHRVRVVAGKGEIPARIQHNLEITRAPSTSLRMALRVFRIAHVLSNLDHRASCSF